MHIDNAWLAAKQDHLPCASAACNMARDIPAGAVQLAESREFTSTQRMQSPSCIGEAAAHVLR